MEARIKFSPSGDLLPYLDAIGEGLVQLNVAWMRSQISMGFDPPCCTACAEPPWTTGKGVDYVPFHGTPKGTSREYLDGPTMFARGRGTCMDVAAYDVACLRVKKGELAARVTTVRVDATEYHALVHRADGSFEDRAMDLAGREPLNVGASLRNGVIVRAPRDIGWSVDYGSALQPGTKHNYTLSMNVGRCGCMRDV